MTKKMAQIALLVAAASVLFMFENLISLPFPWMRLGLANIVTILALLWFGMKEALGILVLRVVLGSLLTGKLLTPLFILSLSGGLTATLVMYLLIRLANQCFSIVGISIIGSLVKNSTQLTVAYMIYIRQVNIFLMLPLFFLTSLVSGFLVGVCAQFINHRMGDHFLLDKKLIS